MNKNIVICKHKNINFQRFMLNKLKKWNIIVLHLSIIISTEISFSDIIEKIREYFLLINLHQKDLF